MSESSQHVLVCDWLIPLGMMSSRFIHVVHVSDFTPLYGGRILCCVCTHHLLFIHLSVGGCLDGVHLLAIVNTAALNI